MFNIFDPLGLWSNTPSSTVGGGANTPNQNNMPWYVVPVLVIIAAALIYQFGKKALKI